MKFKYLFVLMLLCIGVVSATSCYQESANVSNQGGLDGSCSLNYSGSYFAPIGDVSGGYVVIDYIKPITATGGVWIAKVYPDNILNLSIPQDCWNANITSLRLRVRNLLNYPNGISPATAYRQLNCWNGSSYIVLFSDSYNDGNVGTGWTTTSNGADFMFDGDWNTMASALNINQNPYFPYWITESGSPPEVTKYSSFYEEAMMWNVGCTPSWINSNSVCNTYNYTILYSDLNTCNSSLNLPVDNGSIVSCLICSPNWIQSIVPSTCTSGYMTKTYSDANYCNTTLNLPFDNGSISSCNIFSSINADHVVKLFDNFTILAYAPVGAVVNISLQYPNLSSYLSSTSWNGIAFESQSFNAYPNGTYNLTGYSGNQSISGSFVVTDFEAVIPTQFDSIVSAGSNFTFLLKIFTDSNYVLNHSISCIVPAGFSCIVPSSVDVLGNASLNLIVTSNISVPDGLYTGSLVVTRLIDGRTFSASLPLGISTAFGVAQIDNPSSFTQVMYSNEIKYKNYTVTNVGTYNLSDCYVSVDGSFTNQSFVVGSSNFSIAPNESGVVSVAYVMPSSGIYTGYFNVFCVASVGGFINGLSNPQLQQLFVIPYTAPYNPPTGGGGSSVPYVLLSANASTQIFSLLNSGGIAGGYVTYTYALNTFSKTFIVKSNTADTLNLRVTCRGDFCQYVKFSRDSFSLAGFGTDFFTATVSVPKNVDLNSVYSYEVVLTDGSGRSASLINSVHISSLSAWYSKFALITKEGDKGFWFSVGGFNVPKLLLYLLIVLIVDVATVLLMPKNAFYKKNIVLILTFSSLIVFGISALLF